MRADSYRSDPFPKSNSMNLLRQSRNQITKEFHQKGTKIAKTGKEIFLKISYFETFVYPSKIQLEIDLSHSFEITSTVIPSGDARNLSPMSSFGGECNSSNTSRGDYPRKIA